MYSVRLWVVRHAGAFERIYNMFEPVLVKLHPVWSKIGYQRAEKPMSKFEQACKGLLFDCKMCGQCALSSTGMSCSMNCPKNLRNGPCGGVRLNGNCEVYADRRCVWVEGWKGSQKMKNGDRIFAVQKPVNFSQQGSSSWLRVVRQIAKRKEQSGEKSQ
ncbi:methylenetetrahydrofolate reductase C-terminal domain-containing protein [Amphritea sp. HPY]|uniref:methylenetetrahydrofolate reductase C-terminal domain-containing protein n=1 Tax=Amphritea sp. HPY TaxID=3421652 RepID=UPI003D7DCE20